MKSRWLSMVMVLALALGMLVALPAQKASAAITNPGTWTNRYHSTSTLPGAAAASFAVAAGTNRILVVGVEVEGSSSGTLTVTSVTYGGVAMTLAAGDGGTSLSMHTTVYYLVDNTVMDGTNKTLAFNAMAFGGTLTAANVWSAVYAGVDQTTPIADTANYNSGGTGVTSAAFATAMTVNAGDQAIVVASAARATSAVTWNAPTNWTKGNNQPTGTTGLGYVAYRTIPGTNTPDAYNSTLSTARAALTGVVFRQRLPPLSPH